MYDDIALFVHIVQHQSLAEAAQQLTMPAATMTRRLQKLEQTLGCQLIHRSARQFVLTPEGEVYYQAYREQIEQLDKTQRNLSAEMTEISGKLRVLAPSNISCGFLQPMWSAFIKRYEKIQLELYLNNNLEDLLLSQADIALRIGPQQDSLLYQKRLGTLETVLVASPEYIKNSGEPLTLEELRDHDLIGSKAISVWHLRHSETQQKYEFHPRVVAQANDLSLIAKLACDGIGISLLPISEVESYLQSAQLQRILHQWKGPNRDIFAVWPSGRLLNPKAKCLRDFMADYIASHIRQ